MAQYSGFSFQEWDDGRGIRFRTSPDSDDISVDLLLTDEMKPSEHLECADDKADALFLKETDGDGYGQWVLWFQSYDKETVLRLAKRLVAALEDNK